MATITITIPDAVAARVFGAVASAYGYDPASGVTKAAFTKTVVATILKDLVRSQEAREAVKVAQANAEAAVNADVVLS